MRYGQGLLDEILRRTDIVQLVGRRVKLVRKGRVMWGCCPFHKEKSPSFKVENERRTYKCFGCGKGGDAFKWLMETEGLSFPESVERLAAEAGVELPKWTQEDEDREQDCGGQPGECGRRGADPSAGQQAEQDRHRDRRGQGREQAGVEGVVVLGPGHRASPGVWSARRTSGQDSPSLAGM